jgi:hypothetical protein
MGTLQNQPPREYVLFHKLEEDVAHLKELFGEELSTEAALTAALKVWELNLTQHDRDAKDEQLSGFGDLFSRLIDTLEK